MSALSKRQRKYDQAQAHRTLVAAEEARRVAQRVYEAALHAESDAWADYKAGEFATHAERLYGALVRYGDDIDGHFPLAVVEIIREYEAFVGIPFGSGSPLPNHDPLPKMAQRGPDPDLQDILVALGIPEADSKQEILSRISALTVLAEIGTAVQGAEYRGEGDTGTAYVWSRGYNSALKQFKR